MLNVTIVSSFLVAPPIYTHLHQQFIGVVPEPLTGPVLGISLIIAPAIFLFVETIFHAIITHPYSDDLGYYGRFHRGVWVAHKGLLLGYWFVVERIWRRLNLYKQVHPLIL